MAGRRLQRAKADSARTGYPVGDVLKPKQAGMRAARRRAAYLDRLAAAASPGERLAAAADYLRGALKQADPRLAEATADELAELLAGRADYLLFQRNT